MSGPAPDGGYPHLVWVPDGREPPKGGWPVVVWLHGFSLRGDDLTKLKSYGLPAVLDEQPPACVVVAPQLSAGQFAWETGRLDATLKAAVGDLRTDPGRLLVCGASLGGAGTYEWAAANPDRFAGAVVLAAAADPRKAGALSRTPVWAFHGTADRTVTPAKAKAGVKAITDAGGSVEFTELPGVGHDADALTRKAFVDEKALAWLLDRPARRAAAPVPPPSKGGVQEVRDEAGALKAKIATPAVQLEVPSDGVIYKWIEGLCATPHRRPGTPEGHQGEAWVKKAFEQVGLENVRADPVPIKVWQPKAWKLTVDGAEVGCGFMLNTGFTPGAGVSAPLVHAEYGRIGQLKRADVEGRIVVVRAKCDYPDPAKANPREYFRAVPGGNRASGPSAAAFPSNMLGAFLKLGGLDAYSRAQEAGAVGFLMLPGDLRSEAASLYWPYDAEPKPLPGLYVAAKDADAVEAAARRGKAATLVQTGEVTDGTMSNIWGVLPGISDDVLLITSHHDSAHKGAVEDASGVAQVLAQAWAWKRVPKEKRPRTLVFVAAAGHFYKGRGAYEWSKAHPDILNRSRAVLTLEHMPCKEVRPGKSGYEFTGRPQPVPVYASAHPALLAGLWKALDDKPPPFPATVERPLLSIPLSDAAGYVGRSREKGSGYPGPDGLPFVSWISAPLYLVDAHDTLDKLERGSLSATAATVAEVVHRLIGTP